MLNRNREQWLEAAVKEMRPWFEAEENAIPEKVRVSIGFPSRKALSTKSKRVGECWPTDAASDGVSQIFISPLIPEGARALDILVHELVHAAVGTKCGHKGPFAKVAKAVGLAGKMTETTASAELLTKLNDIIDILGPYPHAALNPSLSGRKVQKNRQVLVQCAPCKYKLRGARKTLERGVPSCPVCGEAMVLEDTDND
jgi:hypothetical protein